MYLKIEVSLKVSKNWKITKKMSFRIRQKSALFRAVSEEIDAVQLWIRAVSEKMSAEAALWKFSFSALLRAESALIRDFQIMNNSETDQRLFWIRADQRWMSLRRQPGIVTNFQLKRGFLTISFKYRKHRQPTMAAALCRNWDWFQKVFMWPKLIFGVKFKY